MCLTCCNGKTKILYEKDIKNMFDLSWMTDIFKELGKDVTLEQLKSISSVTGNNLHTHNNKIINLTSVQEKEIADHAIAVIATGVDTSITIWAIQWPNDYVVKTLDLYQ
jgi:hypothetical protein